MPTLPVPGAWRDLPVTPALVTWEIRRADNGKVIVPAAHRVTTSAITCRADGSFWQIYARGTHQNMSVFGAHYSFMQPGLYLIRLAPGGFDTHDAARRASTTSSSRQPTFAATTARPRSASASTIARA